VLPSQAAPSPALPRPAAPCSAEKNCPVIPPTGRRVCRAEPRLALPGLAGPRPGRPRHGEKNSIPHQLPRHDPHRRREEECGCDNAADFLQGLFVGSHLIFRVPRVPPSKRITEDGPDPRAACLECSGILAAVALCRPPQGVGEVRSDREAFTRSAFCISGEVTFEIL